MNLLHHLSIKPEGATGDEQFGLNCRRVLCSHAHGCKRNHGWHGLRFKNDKKERSTQRRKGLTLKDIHKLYLQMWYAVLLPELHYRSLWASMTARLWGKLPHYVPGENEISLSSCILEALLSQTVRVIKSSQFGLEFLSQFSQKEKKNRTCAIVKKLQCFTSSLTLASFPCKQLVCSIWCVHCTRVIWVTMLQDVRHHLRLTQPTSAAAQAGGCVSAAFLLFTICTTEQAVCVCLSVVQQLHSLPILLHPATAHILAALGLLMVFAAVFSMFRPQVLLLFNFQCLHFRSTLIFFPSEPVISACLLGLH